MANFYDNKSALFQALREFDYYTARHHNTDDHGTVTEDRIYELTEFEADEFELDKSLSGFWLIESVGCSGDEGTTYQYCNGCHRVTPVEVKTIKYVKVN